MNQLQTLIRKPKRYENIDGTTDMFFGAMYLGAWAQNCFMPKLSGWAGLLQILPVYGVLFLAWWAGRIIKRRITWPRTGYVAYRRPTRSVAVVFWLAVVVSAAFVWFLVRATKNQDMANLARLAVLAGVLLPYLLLLVLGKEQPWKWLVALFMALGLCVIGLAVPGKAMVLFPPAFVFAGCTWLASGLITLWLYIRHTQPPAAEAE